MSTFSGKERLEMLAALGRPTRQGERLDGDLDQVRRALHDGDWPRARLYLDYLIPQYIAVLAGYAEWIANFRSNLEACCGQAQASTYHDQALRLLATTAGYAKEPAREAVELALTERDGQALLGRLGVGPNQLLAFDTGNLTASTVEGFLHQVRSRQDLLSWYLWALPSVLLEPLGEERVLALSRQSLTEGFGYSVLWQIAAALNPQELATFAAEHLRAHFSGANREGQVEIIEESDRYRVIFTPCGSGGVMRRGAPGRNPGYKTLSVAAPETWGRAGEVSPFCVHCAFNEQMSVQKLGHLAWVTEFDPDPERPCGWTFYKNPADVPSEYYHRLGLKKPD